MADRIIKSDSGNDVVIQNNAGTRKIEVTNAGDVEVTGDFKATTVKATNLKANDGTASLVVADSTGQVTSSAKIDLNGNELILDADGDTSITADTDDQIDFRAGGADTVKIGNEDLTINDGNLVIGTAGHGIDFSINSHASGMTSELLDSYEEGAWTPTNAGDGTGTLTNPSGLYVKIGRTVIVTAVGVVGNTFSGTSIGGLPFIPSAYGSYSDKSRALVGSSRAIKLSSSSSNIGFTDVNGTNASVTSFRFTITYITD